MLLPQIIWCAWIQSCELVCGLGLSKILAYNREREREREGGWGTGWGEVVLCDIKLKIKLKLKTNLKTQQKHAAQQLL